MTLAYEPMEMTGLINIAQEVSAAGTSLTKITGGSGYNSAASSSECIESLHSQRRGLRCKLSSHHQAQNFRIGLTGVEQPELTMMRNSVDPHSSITHAAYIYSSSGSFEVYESGRHVGRFGKVHADDVIEVCLTPEASPKIQYKVNSEIRYTSGMEIEVQAPLFVKVCADLQTPLVKDLQWILEPSKYKRGEVSLAGCAGIVRNGRAKALSKVPYLPGDTFNAVVCSEDAIEDASGDRIGVSFVVSQSESGADQFFAVGLTSDLDQEPSLESLAHAAHIQSSSFKVFEKGVLQGEIHHHVKAGDRIEMVVALDEESSQPKIQYHLNRQLLGEMESEVHFPLYAKVCAKSPGALIEDLRWINRSQHQPPSLRRTMLPALNLADGPGNGLSTASRVRQLEAALGEASEKNVQMEVDKLRLLAEVDALKTAVEQHAQLHAAWHAEKAHLEATVAEQMHLQKALHVEKAQLERQLEEKKVELASHKDASRAMLEEKSSQLDQVQAERDAMQAALEKKSQAHVKSQGLLRPEAQTQGKQQESPKMQSATVGATKERLLEELLLAVMAEKAQLMVPADTSYLQQTQPQEDSESFRALIEDKAQLEKQLKVVTEQNERLQRQQAENEELQCFFKQVGQAFQHFNTRAASRSSEAGSDPWELLGSDGPASSAAADES